MKRSTSFHLSDEALSLLSLLSAHLGISQAGVVEIGVRKLSRLEGVALPFVTTGEPVQSAIPASSATEMRSTIPAVREEVPPKTAKDIRMIPVTAKAKAKAATVG